jgi:thiol:disulfide interchange protein DsbC
MRQIFTFNKWLWATILFVIGISQAVADSRLHDTLQKSLAGRQIISVTATPIKGIFEVVLDGKQIVYASADGEYILVGQLIHLASQENLTEAKMEALNVVDFSTFPLNKAIKEVRGKGIRKLVVFSDPDCFYCKKLEEKSLKGINNVTIYTFLYPLAIHPDAERKARVIWCSANRLFAWKQWILEGKLANNEGRCITPFASLAKLATGFGITGTPTLIFENGEMVAGALEQYEIERYLDKASKLGKITHTH